MLPLRLITDAPNGYDLKVLIFPEAVAQPVDVHVHRAGSVWVSMPQMSSMSCCRVKMCPGEETSLYNSKNSFCGRTVCTPPVRTENESNSNVVVPSVCRRSATICARRAGR